MKIHDVLQGKGADVITVHPDAAVRDVVALLREHNLGAVVVSDDGSTVAGIVTERDVVRHLAEGPDFLTGPVAAIMTAVVHTCTRADTIETLMSTMTDHRIRHVPVVDDEGRLRGIVSIGDVVKSTITELQFERDQLQGYVLS